MLDENILAGKKVLITGGGGFIGSHLCARLLKLGCRIVIADKYYVTPWRLKPFWQEIEFVTVDITDVSAVTEIFRAKRPDCVFHLAAYGVNSEDQDAAAAIRVNVLGTVNVLEAMNKTSCQKIVCMGSGAEYGNAEGKISETRILNPVNIYGSTKAAGTLIAHQYAAEHGIGIVTLRPFGIFGEAEPPHKLICYAILTMLKGDEIELTSCEQSRDYCYVENIVDALIGCMSNESIDNEVFNVGSGISMPLRYYIEKIRGIINPECSITYGRLPQRNEAWSPAPDTSKIRSTLGWRPRYSLDEALQRTVEWYRKNSHLYEKQ